MNAPTTRKGVLVAVPDWGLGHATRSLVIVRRLQELGLAVYLASSGRAGHLLRAECPALPFLELPSYDLHYSGRHMAWNLLKQAPRLAARVGAEYKRLQQYLRRYPIAAVLSDNALGCFSARVPTAYLTHQLHIQYPPWPALAAWSSRLHRFFIRKHDECWIPDWAGPDNLAGALCHPPRPGLAQRYIGPLSRMRPGRVEPKWDLVAVLSGPEPQRSRFEAILFEQLPGGPARSLVVRGKTEQPVQGGKLGAMHWKSWLPAADLNRELAAAGLVLCRSGYSSLMDLAVLGLPAVLVPTPGQTEQMYLARYWAGRKGFATADQANFHWDRLWREKPWQQGRSPHLPQGGAPELLDAALFAFLERAGFRFR